MNAASNPVPAIAADLGFAHQSLPQRVVCKRGCRLDIADELALLGSSRAMFVTGPRAHGHPGAQEIKGSLLPLLADEFLEVDPRMPTSLVASFASRTDAAGADVVVAFGGGATIDLAKAGARATGQLRGSASEAPAVVAIPSTLVGAELTAVPGGGARTVLYDPEVLARAGLSSVLASGAAALSHGAEALYRRGDPLVETAAAESIYRLADALPRFRDDPEDLVAAQGLFHGAYLAAFAMSRSQMGLAHGIARTLSARTPVSYSVAHAIVLPHALRYNRSSIGDRVALAGRALGAAYRSEPDDDAAVKTCNALERLMRALGLPVRLSDVGIEEGALLSLAEAALANPCMMTNPKPIESAGQILSVLRAAF
ncbi:MAG TPA: iron-containing alcohol dehydrogenase [Candidatus Eremiobacteraceae bacterium]|nr:iron-containing alcohol dehydrogenase [Candidatus Eremiobacteraceae bacterium]